MMLRMMILGLVTAMLSGCYYSKGCIYGPQSADCPFRPEVKGIQQWQKKDSIGNTNPEQRIRDLKECGVGGVDYGMAIFNGTRPNESDDAFEVRRSKKYQCVKDKGYIFITEYECRTESQTKLNGKCN
ncbi:hypothetical protein NKT77_01030 [Moraxella sp. FZLJ2107]|uniref:hypothetical protein n=1 Tax=unclassified Moraxella TaxID=2685852 RepID=UPI0020C8507C|nr:MULTISPECIES: hypothetical protein [unclassified Moraxella]UTO05272.1 hypothetical protein NKT77_01030 [Moraxella sp. FZLJ2107]UTO22007.1 hypothetical protein NKU06_09330 [Moraxella sp. FZLJ2109]